jgi:hypothetical protein
MDEAKEAKEASLAEEAGAPAAEARAPSAPRAARLGSELALPGRRKGRRVKSVREEGRDVST